MKVFAQKLLHTIHGAHWIVLATLFLMILRLPGRSLILPEPNQLELLSLSEARSYMLDLINRDRATANLKPLKLDLVATSAGQKHSDEMANYGYISHYNLDGKSPDQRYSENGGDYYVRENIYLKSRMKPRSKIEPLKLDDQPKFTRAEIKSIEESYFNESPPHDGHRKNILRPEHTHVGIGIGRAKSPTREVLANVQEFVDHYIEMAERLPNVVPVGTMVNVSGKVPPGSHIKAVTVSRAPSPKNMTKKELEQSGGYSIPTAFASYWPEPYQSPRPILISNDGRFQVGVTVSDGLQPGLYFITVWLNEHDHGTIIGSQRTIVAR